MSPSPDPLGPRDQFIPRPPSASRSVGSVPPAPAATHTAALQRPCPSAEAQVASSSHRCRKKRVGTDPTTCSIKQPARTPKPVPHSAETSTCSGASPAPRWLARSAGARRRTPGCPGAARRRPSPASGYTEQVDVHRSSSDKAAMTIGRSHLGGRHESALFSSM